MNYYYYYYYNNIYIHLMHELVETVKENLMREKTS